MLGIFDDFFDMNNDGKLDSLEKAGEAAFVMGMIESESEIMDPGDAQESFDFEDPDPLKDDIDDDNNEEDDEIDEEDEEEKRLQILQEELEAEGLDVDELDLMDEEERREVLEEAGLDPDDYDDLFFW